MGSVSLSGVRPYIERVGNLRDKDDAAAQIRGPVGLLGISLTPEGSASPRPALSLGGVPAARAIRPRGLSPGAEAAIRV